MTPEQINRLLAEQIMGFKRQNTIINLKGKYWHKPDDWIITEYEWHPYTDIRQAFEVVEQMRKRKVVFNLFQNNTGKWYASFDNFDEHGYGSGRYCNADTPSAAICCAAVEAIKDSDNPNNPKPGIDQGD